MADYDVVGNIAIIKGEGKTKKEKIAQAKEILGYRPSVKTVVEKIGNVKGRLRTIETKHVFGEKNLVAMHKENNCRFLFNVETCYFSPRLANERLEISRMIKKSDRVLVMFAGVGVYPIVIYKESKPKEIVGVELGRDCCKYFKENLKYNKIPEKMIKVIQGDVKKKVDRKLGKFEKIVMARPNLKDTFLKWALDVSKKGTIIYYYGFCNRDEIDKMIKDLIDEAKKYKKKVKLINCKTAGDIAPYKFRYRIEFKVM